LRKCGCEAPINICLKPFYHFPVQTGPLPGNIRGRLENGKEAANSTKTEIKQKISYPQGFLLLSGIYTDDRKVQVASSSD